MIKYISAKADWPNSVWTVVIYSDTFLHNIYMIKHM